MKSILLLTAVFFLMTALPVQASISYTDLGEGVYLKGSDSGEAIYEFDADTDGLTDVAIHQNHYPSHGYNEAFFQMEEMGPYARDNKTQLAISYIWNGWVYFAKPFSNGAVIGPGETWVDVNEADGFIGFEYSEPGYIEGDWQNLTGSTGYAGFNFYSTIDEAWHYGWMLLEVDSADDSAITLHSYAWEMDANTAIIAGNTGSPVPVPGAVWLMGSGLLGLVGIQRKKKQS